MYFLSNIKSIIKEFEFIAFFLLMLLPLYVYFLHICYVYDSIAIKYKVNLFFLLISKLDHIIKYKVNL